MSQELAMKTYIQTSDKITPIHSNNKEIDRCSYMDNFEVPRICWCHTMSEDVAS